LPQRFEVIDEYCHLALPTIGGRPDRRRRIAMKAVIIVAAVALPGLAAGKVFAFGYPGMQPSVFAAHAFPNEPYHTGTVFSEIFCHHAKHGSAAAHNATPATAAGPLSPSVSGQYRSFAAGRSP
jgi:hypothetical protein